MSDTRWCPTCFRHKSVALFKLFESSGRYARDCIECNEKRAARASAPILPPIGVQSKRLLPTKEFPGVDIDAIHRKRGARK